MVNPTHEQLRQAIVEIDSMAQAALGEIAAMASLALLAMEQPSTYATGVTMEAIARTLMAIKSKAQDIDNGINYTAECVGCNYVDAAQLRRWEAQGKAHQTTLAGVG